MVLHEAALTQITPRRLELLMACARLPAGFTTADARAEMKTPASSSASLTRDLRALEAGGWLVARPSRREKRQGRTVRYRVNRRLARTAFHDWGRLLNEALTSGQTPSGS